MSVRQSEITAVIVAAMAETAKTGAKTGLHWRVIVDLFRQLEQLRAFCGCRNEVFAFALHMERRLQQKDPDRGVSWKHRTPKALSIDLVGKAMALDTACVRMAAAAGAPDPDDLQVLHKHAVDVANYALFIAGVAGEIAREKASAGESGGGTWE